MPDATAPSGQRTLFRDGIVFDGSGTPPVPADVVPAARLRLAAEAA